MPTQAELRGHKKRVHERVKCEKCSQEICNAFLLKRHKAKVHGIKPLNVHNCEKCPMFFHNKGYLDKHISKIHPEN